MVEIKLSYVLLIKSKNRFHSEPYPSNRKFHGFQKQNILPFAPCQRFLNINIYTLLFCFSDIFVRFSFVFL